MPNSQFTFLLRAVTHPSKDDLLYNLKQLAFTTAIELPLEFLSFHFHAALVGALSVKLSTMFLNWFSSDNDANHPATVDTHYHILDTGINSALLLTFAIHMNSVILAYFSLRILSTLLTKTLSYRDRVDGDSWLLGRLYTANISEPLSQLLNALPLVSSTSPASKVTQTVSDTNCTLKDKIIVISDLSPRDALQELQLEAKATTVPLLFLSTKQLLSLSDKAKAFSKEDGTLQKLHQDIFRDAEVHLVAKLSGQGNILGNPSGKYTPHIDCLRKLLLGDGTRPKQDPTANYHMHWIDNDSKQTDLEEGRDTFLASDAATNSTMREFFPQDNCYYHTVIPPSGMFAKKYPVEEHLLAHYDLTALPDIYSNRFRSEADAVLQLAGNLFNDTSPGGWRSHFIDKKTKDLYPSFKKITDIYENDELSLFEKCLQGQRIAFQALKTTSTLQFSRYMAYSYISEVLNRRSTKSKDLGSISLQSTIDALMIPTINKDVKITTALR